VDPFTREALAAANAFALDSFGSFGDASRNLVTGPRMVWWNFSEMRNFRRCAAAVRVEVELDVRKRGTAPFSAPSRD